MRPSTSLGNRPLSALGVAVGVGWLSGGACVSYGGGGGTTSASTATTGVTASAAASASSTAGAGGGDGAGGAFGEGGGGGATRGGSGGGALGPRALPGSASKVVLFVDRLPTSMSAKQIAFAASHFDATRRVPASTAKALRAHRPEFLVLHERVAMWQGGPDLEFLIDGQNLGSDYDVVTEHEAWFWHRAGGARVASALDGKWLMNVADTDYQAYWVDSVATPCSLGDFDGVVATSGSPTAVVTEGLKPEDPRLADKGVVKNELEDLGGFTYAERWEGWASGVSEGLESRGLPLFIDVGALEFAWDTTDYLGSTKGVMVDLTLSSTAEANAWLSFMNRLIVITKERPAILKGRLDASSNRELRRYFLGVYLLVKGEHTYLDMHASNALEWYPELSVDLGVAEESASSIDQLVSPGGMFRRRFEKGWVYVNPTDGPIPAQFDENVFRVASVGGGSVFANGEAPGVLSYVATKHFNVEAHSAEVFHFKTPAP